MNNKEINQKIAEHSQLTVRAQAGMNNESWWSSRQTFMQLWDNLNAKRGYGWETDPCVWVYEFERCEKPEGWPDA